MMEITSQETLVLIKLAVDPSVLSAITILLSRYCLDFNKRMYAMVSMI